MAEFLDVMTVMGREDIAGPPHFFGMVNVYAQDVVTGFPLAGVVAEDLTFYGGEPPDEPGQTLDQVTVLAGNIQLFSGFLTTQKLNIFGMKSRLGQVFDGFFRLVRVIDYCH
jgi:hypothetical protein